MPCLRAVSCQKHSVRVVHFWITIMMAGWTFSWLIAAPAIFGSLRSLFAMRCTKTIATVRSRMSPKRPACPAPISVWVWPLGITTTMAGRTFSSPPMENVSCTKTIMTEPSPMSPAKLVSPLQDGPPARSGLITTMTASWIFLFAVLSTIPVCANWPAAITKSGRTTTASRVFSILLRVFSTTTTETAHSPTSAKERRLPSPWARASAWSPPT